MPASRSEPETASVRSAASASRLHRSFLAVALAAVAALMLAAGLGLRGLLRDASIRHAEEDAIKLTQALRDRHGPELIARDAAGAEAVALAPEALAALDDRLKASMASFRIMRIRLYNAAGEQIYSTDGQPLRYWEVPDARERVAEAARGPVASRGLESDPSMYETDDNPIVYVRAFVPVQASDGRVIGAFEVCKDVTRDLEAAQGTLARSLGAVLIGLAAVFGALTALMSRARRAMAESARALAVAEERQRADAALRAVVEGTSAAVGDGFHRSLVRSLADAFRAKYAFVGEVVPDGERARWIRVVAIWSGDRPGEEFAYALAGSPCETILRQGPRMFPARVPDLFPDNPRLAAMGVESYMGAPLLDASGQPIGIIGVFHDGPMPEGARHEGLLRIFAARAGAELERAHAATELERSRERLRSAERLASLGAVAAGVGHDLNNLLLPMRGELRSLQSLPLEERPRGHVEALAEAVDFLSGLGDSLRLVSGGGPMESAEARTALTSWWQQAEPLLRRALPPRVTLEVDIAPDLPDARVSPARLTQAALNLLLNAADATDSVPGGGRVRIAARAVDGENAVRIAFADNGCGMRAEVARHAFDPFFTTKPRQASTGLGLAVVQGLAAAAGGRAEIDSTPGRGATITLTFPTAPRETTPERGASAGRPASACVSVADPRVAAYVLGALRDAGLRTVSVAAGADTASLAATCDVWVTDGGPGAADTARRIAEMKPGVRVVALGEMDAPCEGIDVVSLAGAVDNAALRRAVC